MGASENSESESLKEAMHCLTNSESLTWESWPETESQNFCSDFLYIPSHQDSGLSHKSILELLDESAGVLSHGGVLEGDSAGGSIGLAESVSIGIGSCLGDTVWVHYKRLTKSRDVEDSYAGTCLDS